MSSRVKDHDHLLVARLSLVLVDVLLGGLHEPDDVSHAQDSPGHALRGERVEVLDLLSRSQEKNRGPGDLLQAHRRAATRIAVHLREDDARERQALVEGLGGLHRVLAGHGIDHQDLVVGLGGRRDLGHLVHEQLVHVQPARGIEDDHVAAVGRGLRHARLTNPGRRSPLQVKDRDVQRSTQHAQLLHRGGALHIRGDHHRALAVPVPQVLGELRTGGRLASALEAGHQNDRGPSSQFYQKSL